jgi:hypothetical protein
MGLLSFVKTGLGLDSFVKLGIITGVNPQKMRVDVKEYGVATPRKDVPFITLFGGITKVPKPGDIALLINVFGKRFVIASFYDMTYTASYKVGDAFIETDNAKIYVSNAGKIKIINKNGYGFIINEDGTMEFWAEKVLWNVGNNVKGEWNE